MVISQEFDGQGLLKLGSAIDLHQMQIHQTKEQWETLAYHLRVVVSTM